MDKKTPLNFKKMAAAFIVCAAAFLFSAVGAWSAEEGIPDPEISCAGEAPIVCRVDETVNIRKSPTTRSNIVGKLRRGDRVKAGDLKNYWRPVFDVGQSVDGDAEPMGYVYAPLLKPAGNTTSKARISTAGQDPDIRRVRTRVNIRKSPDIRSEVVGKLRPGDRVKAGTPEDGWRPVFKTNRDGDALGYVYAPLLKPAGSAAPRTKVRAKAPAKAPAKPRVKAQPKAPGEVIAELKKQVDDLEEEVLDLGDRLDEAELHTATDKLSFDFELRSRCDSIHYNEVKRAPEWFLDAFSRDGSVFRTFSSVNDLETTWKGVLNPLVDMNGSLEKVLALKGFGFDGLPATFAENLRKAMQLGSHTPNSESYNLDDDTIWTNKFMMNMKAKIKPSLSFTGRLAMYKVFGDSSAMKVNNGAFGDIFLDSNTSSLPHGDSIRLERAYFNWKTKIGATPINFSLGRRPATMGAPLEYAAYGLEGGSPLASLVNMQFDGASLTFSLEDKVGVPGFSFKLCYGVGFESGWGNSFSLGHDSDSIKDATFGGFISTLYDDGLTSLVVNYAHAWNITDGFSGLMVMPFQVTRTDEWLFNARGEGIDKERVIHIKDNSAGVITKMEPYTNIGDFDLLGALFRTNLSSFFEDLDIDLFLALSWSHTEPSQLSDHPFYRILGAGLLCNDDLKSRDGYSLYMGAVFPAFGDDRLGLEFNWGSKYWFNMTSAEDSLVASKLSARGTVVEGYYIKPIVGRNMFLTLGARYYDYKYTLSGNPMGAPVPISDADAIGAIFPTPDTVWDLYTSFTVRY
ncbi:conserved exported hypothetical protein [Candidatus Desulfarcum epimagneticum]|uniref:SH3b domain-containing protein n=1 Tax=uncultured Desulfobacteraceae bacterium TaxID=218296 RepID=A0A484HKN5_9BACT|nr:conserved exported hypothetical protein [uncultured Desulfobacteraceae bacterium]